MPALALRLALPLLATALPAILARPAAALPIDSHVVPKAPAVTPGAWLAGVDANLTPELAVLLAGAALVACAVVRAAESVERRTLADIRVRLGPVAAAASRASMALFQRAARPAALASLCFLCAVAAADLLDPAGERVARPSLLGTADLPIATATTTAGLDLLSRCAWLGSV